MATPEQQAREKIDSLLEAAGWHVFDATAANIHAGRGVAIREFPLKSGHGYADYLLYVDYKAAGVIEAKKEGAPLSGVEVQSAKYGQGLPDGLPRWRDPLPFAYLDQCMYGQGRPHLRFEQLMAAPIALPSPSEQNCIVAEVDRRLFLLSETEAQVGANLQRAEHLRHTILTTIFTRGRG